MEKEKPAVLFLQRPQAVQEKVKNGRCLISQNVAPNNNRNQSLDLPPVSNQLAKMNWGG